MAFSTYQVAGLSSGFDWRNMIDQLIAVEHRGVDLVENRKSEYEAKLTEWQAINTKLLSLKTAAEALKDPDNFQLYNVNMATNSSSVAGEDLLSITTGSSAVPGSYAIKVTNLAMAQKLSSNPFTSRTGELGAGYAGDLVINGKVIAIQAADALSDVAFKINNVNTGSDPSGVTASIVNYGANDYRLILTSDSSGEDGISLLNGSTANLVQKFGWKDNQTAVVKNAITAGAQSDVFSSHNVGIMSLLGLSTGEASTGSLTIDGTVVDIDLSTDSLTDIKNAINTAMAGAGKGDQVVASIVTETVDGSTRYRLQVDGTQTFVDEKNIFNTLGILDHGSVDVSGKVSGNSMTTDGAYIGPDTQLVDIDGYISYTGAPQDSIQMTGMQTGGAAANYTFNIESATTVQDLLDAIESQYATSQGDVVAYVTSDGKIRVDDVADGGSLSVILTDNITNGQLEFVDGDLAFGDGATRKREVVSGEDAAVEIDGVEVTGTSNVIEDVIPGLTLNLINEDDTTTVTVNIARDTEAVKSKIQDLVDSYNEVMSHISVHFTYDVEAEKTGGVLFGDSTLRSVKSDLSTLLSETIRGVDGDFSSLGLIGIANEISDENVLTLTIDETVLNSALQTNFIDVMGVFAGQGTASDSSTAYIGHTRDTEAGEYDIHIYQAATRGSETGNVDLSAGGAEETLTITQGNATANITITSGMTLDDVVNEINGELDQVLTQSIVGDEQLYSDSGITTEITSSTTWNSIYDSTGTQLSFSTGDTISFSGTTRSGSAVSGNYEIGDAATDTVQGFLSAIENAFSGKIITSIDTSGRIVVTDEFEGTSQLSLDSIAHASEGEFFGSVDVTAGAGDGSQEGRYAMDITAMDDGSNHLILRNDKYGSTAFTISQDSSDDQYTHMIYSDTSNTTRASGGTVQVASDTTWADVYGADVTTGETIQITGTARNGAAISGTHNIDTDNTVETLLQDIETAYAAQGTTVDAFVRDGKIYVEDTTAASAGPNPITLTLTYNGSGSLDLGLIDQETERDLDLGLINGEVTGKDVAGTIDGESATGSGQLLRGDDGNPNTDGLAISYTGSSSDVDVGSVTVTLGIAELLDRALFSITDAFEGYVAFKQDSLQSSISRFEEQIEEMEARLDKRMEVMINRFVTMELTLSQLQNQSNWLAGQINSMFMS